MVIPDVDHWDLGIGHAEKTLRKPHRVPIQIELLQFVLHFLRERSVMLIQWVSVLGPLSEQHRLLHGNIVVDLVTSTEHDMKWSTLV